MTKLYTVLAIDANNSPAMPWSSGYSESKQDAINAFYNEQLDNLCFEDDDKERKKEFIALIENIRESEIGKAYKFETMQFAVEELRPIQKNIDILNALTSMVDMVTHHRMDNDEKRSILRNARLAIKAAQS